PTTENPVISTETETPAPTFTATLQVCSGYLPSRLTTGGQGRVTPGKPNRLRSLPNVSSNWIGTIQAGTVFDVVRGPQCSKDGAWWLITSSSGTGWTVEGDAKAYYLEPFTELAEGASGSSAESTTTAEAIAPIPPTNLPPTEGPSPSPTAQGGGTGNIVYTAKV